MTTYVWPVNNISIPGAATEATLADILTSVELIDDTILTNSHTSQKEVAVIEKGHVCTENSTTTELAGGATFTGTWQDILDYNSITIAVLADQDSATDGLVVQWSADGTTLMDTDVFTVLANKPKVFTFGGYARYFRVVYTNGATLQGTFILQSIVRTSYGKDSSHRIKDTIVGDDDATLTKALLTAKTEAGSYINIDATNGGNLKISLEEFDGAVLGQETMANSLPVTIASNQSAIPVLNNSSLVPYAYDYISYTSGATTDTYVYKTGGAGGTTVATVTLTYTDTTKAVLSNVART